MIWLVKRIYAVEDSEAYCRVSGDGQVISRQDSLAIAYNRVFGSDCDQLCETNLGKIVLEQYKSVLARMSVN